MYARPGLAPGRSIDLEFAMDDKKSSNKHASQGASSGGARFSQAPKAAASVPVQILAVGVVVALVVGVLVGHFVLGVPRRLRRSLAPRRFPRATSTG